MYTKHKYDIIVIFAILGLGISLFLAITHYYGFAVPCTVTHGCDVVLSSKYASFLGFPLSVWGVGYFIAVIFSALMANHYNTWRKLLTILLSIGALGSLVLLSLQFFVIKKVCQYCLTTDVVNILLFVLDLNIEHKAPEIQ